MKAKELILTALGIALLVCGFEFSRPWLSLAIVLVMAGAIGGWTWYDDTYRPRREARRTGKTVSVRTERGFRHFHPDGSEGFSPFF